MMSIAEISSAPTMRMPTATTSASAMLSTHCSTRGEIRSATAISGESVARISRDQRQKIRAATAAAPSQIVTRSPRVTDRMSPNSQALRSLRTPWTNDTATSPAASAAWASTPSRVSTDCRPDSAPTAAAIASATAITAGASGSDIASDSATPSSAAWAVASP